MQRSHRHGTERDEAERLLPVDAAGERERFVQRVAEAGVDVPPTRCDVDPRHRRRRGRPPDPLSAGPGPGRVPPWTSWTSTRRTRSATTTWPTAGSAAAG